MPSAIAFFPWIYIERPIMVGPLRLLPYRRAELPGDLPNVKQNDIDGVLAAYANRPTTPIKRATLIEFGEWHSGMDPSAEAVDNLRRAKDVLAFSAISKRVLFRGHFDYCNTDAYDLVIQRYIASDAGIFSFSTRRRDTGTTHMWSNDSFAFQRPSHTSPNWQITFDESLVVALLDATEKDERLYEAIVEFNLANTDSSAVPEHVEVVMCKSAFELLLNIDEKQPEFLRATKQLLNDISFEEYAGPLAKAWAMQWPNSDSPLMAWAREFCFVRNNAAHGNEKRKKLVWTERTHLAFTSVLFPLLVRKILSDRGLLPPSEELLEDLRHINSYVLTDPFDFDFGDSEKTHPWIEIGQKARMKAIARKHGWGA